MANSDSALSISDANLVRSHDDGVASRFEPLFPESVGARLRRYRQSRGFRLRDVAARTGLSESYLSQLERDKSSGSVSSLLKICTVLGYEVGDLFSEQVSDYSDLYLNAFADIVLRPFGVGGHKAKLTPTWLKDYEVLIATFTPGGSTGDGAYIHGDSYETISALEGQVLVTVGDEVHKLAKFDSVSFQSSRPHRVRNIGEGTATVLWVIAPATY